MNTVPRLLRSGMDDIVDGNSDPTPYKGNAPSANVNKEGEREKEDDIYDAVRFRRIDNIEKGTDMTEAQKREFDEIEANHNAKSKLEFPAPDGENDWEVGAETFTRREVFNLLWTQRAMIINDIKRSCSLSEELTSIMRNPRIPKF